MVDSYTEVDSHVSNIFSLIKRTSSANFIFLFKSITCRVSRTDQYLDQILGEP